MKKIIGLVLGLLLVSSGFYSRAFLPPERPKLPDLDRREPAGLPEAGSTEQAAAMALLRNRLPQVRVQFDPVSGSPMHITAAETLLSGPGGQGKTLSASVATLAASDHYGPTKAFLQEHRALFGYGPEALQQARIQHEFHTPHNGLLTVIWEQQVDGIAVFEGTLISHTTRSGELVNLSNRFVRHPDQAADRGTPARKPLMAAPTISAAEAIARAGQSLGESARAEDVSARTEPDSSPEKNQKFTAPFLAGESRAKLTWLPMDTRNLRLCWEVILTSRQRGEMFRVLADARTGEVLVRRCLTEYISDAMYNVFTSDSPSPFSPGYTSPQTGQPPLVSRNYVTWSALDTNASPNGWINDGGNETLGNNVDAHTDRNGDNSPDLPRPQGAPFRVFDFPLDLSQSPTTYSAAAVVQLFYWCNWMHDKLYELGFTEAAGNFQSNNFSRGGLDNDALQADAQDGSGYNNANMSVGPDGYPPRMQMYLFNGPTPARDGDLDAEVVLHEYTHGLSCRRVGGGIGISALQTEGMGEGWSDFYALTLLSEAGDDVDGSYPCGGYASYLISSGYINNYYYGIRRYPYSTDMTRNPLTFKDIDPAQASAHSGILRSPAVGTTANEVHNMGEVWCVTLWEARAALIHKLGYAPGNQLILQLVTDGMNLSPANPTFLQARDAILQADVVDTSGANRKELWAAFAKRGMGRGATSPASSTTTGLVEAFDVPDALVLTPPQLSASGPMGGPFTPNPAFFTLSNSGSATLAWSLVNTSAWVTVSPTSGSLASGGAAAVNVSLANSTTNLTMGSYTAGMQFTDQTSGVQQTGQYVLSVAGRSMFDDFDPGIDLTQWAGFGGTVGSTVLATNYGGSVSGPNSLWFGDAGSRFATTLPINTTSGGTILFYIRLANGPAAPWEQVDNLPYEGVVLEATTNSGASWTTLGNYDTTAYYVWTQVVMPIPPTACSQATQFRWRQLSHSGLGFDHWALDNVSIDAGPMPPSIQSQLQDQTVVVGGRAVFVVSASGTQPMNYHWLFNGTNTVGANTNSLVLSNVQFSDAGTYSVVLSNSIGVAVSSNALLTVTPIPPCTPPPVGLVSWWPGEANAQDQVGTNTGVLEGSVSFAPGEVRQAFSLDSTNADVRIPASPSLDVGAGSGFTVEAWINPVNTASLQPIFEWNSGGGQFGVHFYISTDHGPGTLYANIVDANLVNHTLLSSNAPVQSNAFQHVALAYDKSSGTTTIYCNGTVVAQAAPGALRPLTSYDLYLGRRPPGGDGPFGFVGLLDEASLFSRALSQNEIQSIYQAGQAGKCNGSTPPCILMQPASLIVAQGGGASFSVQAAGTAPLGYQWLFQGTNLPSATNTFLTLTGVTTNQAGPYSVIITNAYGSATSSLATLSVHVPSLPAITHQPDNLTVPAGTNALFTVTATGDSPIGYQWFYGNTALPGTGTSTLYLTNVQAASMGGYSVIVTNPYGAATSSVATLVVTPAAPMIAAQPLSQAVFPGFAASFNLAASGTQPFTYQWQRNGTNLAGATNSQYSLTNVQRSDAGFYNAIVSNSVSSILSSNALLAISPAAAWGSDSCGQTDFPLGITNAVSISAGAYHNLALRQDSTVVAWGSASLTNVPAGLSNVLAVSAGGTYSLALKADGTIAAWGDNSYGQTNVPVGLTNVLAVAAGATHSLALLNDGTVAAWGLNASGQCSLPAGLSNITAIAANASYSLALRADGKVFTWGLLVSNGISILSAQTDVVAIAAGGNHALALRSDGTVVAWGDNTYGQTNVPQGLSNVVAIAAGTSHSLALKRDGTMLAWGAGSLPYLQTIPHAGQSLVPISATNLTAVAGGTLHSLAYAGNAAPFITEPPISRTAYSGRRVMFRAAATGAWPLQYRWQLNGQPIPGATNQFLVIDSATATWAGDYRVVASNALGTATSSAGSLRLQNSAPILVSQPTNQTVFLGSPVQLQVAADGSGPLFYQWRLNGTNLPGATNAILNLNRLSLSQAGLYSVVISNAFGEISSSKVTISPVQMLAWGGTGSVNYGQTNIPAGLSGVVNATGGGYHTLALKADGHVLAWGAGTNSVVSYPQSGQSIVPANLSNVVAVAGGGYHSLVLKADGSLAGWGAGASNTGSIPNYGQATIPAGLTNVSAIAAGDYFSMALKNNGGLTTWGYSSYGATNVPPNATNVVAIAARANNALALKADGSLVHWGTSTALPPAGTSNILAIATGVNHCLALRSDGTVVSWGNQYPVPAGLSNVVEIAAGTDFSLALKSDGTVTTWGNTNAYGLWAIPPGLSNVVDIGCGYYHSLAVLGDGSVLIKYQPTSVSAYIGSTAAFRVIAMGAPPLSYQWQLNGSSIPAATNATLALNSVQITNAGSYRVIITNAYGAVTSSLASLQLLVPLGQALNTTNLLWGATGNAAWFGQTNITHDGIAAAQSGPLLDLQQSSLQTSVAGAGQLSFWWKVSSEEFFDYLTFYIDGVAQTSISGEVDWQPQTIAIGNGSHVLRWTYAKDPSVSVGADAGWLDQVNYVTNPPVITIQPPAQTVVSAGAVVTLNVSAAGAPPFIYQWFKGGTSVQGANASSLTLSSATRRDTALYSVQVANPGGATLSSNDAVQVRVPQVLSTCTGPTNGVFTLLSGDADGGQLATQDLTNFEVLVSSNLATWQVLTNSLSLSFGKLCVIDLHGPTNSTRFYRIRERYP